jgi:hypothetical protein
MVSLPYVFAGSAYVSPVGEAYNSTEFEVAGPTGDFQLERILNLKRDFEDFFQIESAAYFSPINQMANVDIFQVNLDSTQVFQGKNWIRVRYRDQNLEWSPWSDPQVFYALNGKTPLDLEPIAWWHFNGDAVDATGHGFDGTVPANGVSFPADGPPRGQVAQFENTQSIPVRTGPGASQGLPVTQITVGGWVKVGAADTWGGFVGCLQDNGSYEKGWVLGTRGQRFSFALASLNAGNMTYLSDNADFNLGEWYYLTATYDGATMKLFVNGALKNSSTAQQGDIAYAGLESDWFGLGAYVDENENWPHDGSLDEIIIWERALSEAEVGQWYVQQSNMAPGIALQAPLANANFVAPASIPMSAEATDPDGSISVVEFFSGSQKLYEDVDGPPYAFVWDNVPVGTYSISARATDNLGLKTSTPPVSVTVENVVSGSGEPFASPIAVAPNPTGGIFRFQTDESLIGAKVLVYNTDKRLVLRQTLTQNTVDLGGAPPGLYWVELQAPSGHRFQASLLKN